MTKTINGYHDDGDEVELTVPMQIIRRNFILNYCASCHSLQGNSVAAPKRSLNARIMLIGSGFGRKLAEAQG